MPQGKEEEEEEEGEAGAAGHAESAAAEGDVVEGGSSGSRITAQDLAELVEAELHRV